MIAAIKDEKELFVLLCNTIQELPVTLEDMKKKQLRKMNSLKKMKKQVWLI